MSMLNSLLINIKDIHRENEKKIQNSLDTGKKT